MFSFKNATMRRGGNAVNPGGGWPGDRVRAVFRNALLPSRCLLCLETLTTGDALCSGCSRDLPWIGAHCRRCALPLPVDGLCGPCQRETPSYDSVSAPLIYGTPVDALLRGLKFHDRLDYARTLAGFVADQVRVSAVEMPTLLVPVPLHPRRLRERGFNQAAQLAAYIGRDLCIPMDARACERLRHTPPQSDLSAAARRRNLHEAFRVVRPNPPSHIAIVDDVMTTGATVDALSRVLRRQGVERIEVWVCARTPG